MTTELLGLDELVAAQGQKEVTHNTALRQIEGRLVRALSKALAVPPSSPAAGDSYIVATGGSGAWSGQAGKIAHFFGGSWKFWQPIEGVRLWVNDEDKVYAFDGAAWVATGGETAVTVGALISGATAKTAPVDADYLGLMDSAASNVLKKVSWANIKAALKAYFDTLYATVSQPFDLTAFYPGVPSASAIVTRVPVARAITFPSALSGSIGKASVAATAQTDFDVQKNGSSVGTIRFAAAATSATFIAASPVSLAAGDILSILAPGTADATLANVGIVLAGSR